MHHHRSGSGAPLVLIHGVGHHWQAWEPVIDRLGGRFDVLACDSPGFGQSPPLPAGTEPTLWAYVDAFERFLSEHGLDAPHVAGNSMGGAIALELARRGRVASATAFSPAGFWTAAERRYALLSLAAFARMPMGLQPGVRRLARTPAGRAALLAQLVKRPSAVPFDVVDATLVDAFAAPAFAGTLAAFEQYTFTGGGQLDGARVTVAWGDCDRLLPYGRQAPRARNVLPHARHVTLDAGHLPFYDAPDAVASVIRATAAAA
ncbi:alpha/beta fold hydrolase [Pseudonocardia sp.]|uniref:alpha/beta fold hydrolase n=1 Tax=Pseudonocardia sp. TaxID=60912 RepID=UPI003D0EAAC8